MWFQSSESMGIVRPFAIADVKAIQGWPASATMRMHHGPVLRRFDTPHTFKRVRQFRYRKHDGEDGAAAFFAMRDKPAFMNSDVPFGDRQS